MVQTLGDFSASATVIDFQIADNLPINTQFSGITFGPGLVGVASAAIDPTGGLSAANFVDAPDCSQTTPCNPIVVDFSQPVARVGFLLLTNNADDTEIRTFQASGGGYAQTGSFFFTTDVNEIFIGVGDAMGGIDRIEIDVTDVRGAFIMDFLRFEPLAAPEPGTAALLAAAGLAAAWTRRRGRRA